MYANSIPNTQTPETQNQGLGARARKQKYNNTSKKQRILLCVPPLSLRLPEKSRRKAINVRLGLGGSVWVDRPGAESKMKTTSHYWQNTYLGELLSLLAWLQGDAKTFCRTRKPRPLRKPERTWPSERRIHRIPSPGGPRWKNACGDNLVPGSNIDTSGK
ncbi:uncharacterized protein FOMMEDRAFT_26759 [Fomitiporia mediterranea MF3/22]|uniref:uncharacterized protein n=1 Tax=Fomitiporia mediterranea (strain MF3/22) TaxID=694068 RepID=UPI0004409C9E|nr:uncharacterized protein FOMMEDRAFT_26759 [Fomitiporia mediterranea MF3/22]EJD05972.1 hypothetical protein FOMMEDRAFT_26759 [Fomitiporia mediterranea MF3/22]